MKLIINADDLGLSPGFNSAIQTCSEKGPLTHASIMMNGQYFEDAYERVIDKSPDLNIGLHVTLDYSRPVSKEADLFTDDNGRFKYDNYFKLWAFLFNNRNNPQVFRQLRTEIEAQILKAMDCGITLAHIDGHNHIHTIPFINRIVLDLANKYNIPRIRLVDEKLIHTLRITHSPSFLYTGGIFKFLFFKFINRINHRHYEASRGTYYFSILHTCRLLPEFFQSFVLPRNYSTVEMVFHVGNPEVDVQYEFDDDRLRSWMLSRHRRLEYEACMELGKYAKALNG